jgi:segregation and condensation protein A
MSLPTISLDVFEGPFDALLELAQARKIDLNAITLSHIADDFLTYITTTPVAAEIQADFLLCLATLVRLKAYALLPRDEDSATIEQEAVELSERLRLYQLYRTQARYLQRQWKRFPLLAGPSRLASMASRATPAVVAPMLATAMERVIRRLPSVPRTHQVLRRSGLTFEHCLTALKNQLQHTPQLVFQDLLKTEDQKTKALTFMAALELARQRLLQLQQERPYDNLILSRL